MPEEQGHLLGRSLAQKVLHAIFDDPERTLKEAAAVLGGGLAGVEQAEALQRLMEQFTMPEDGEFTESDIDKYVTGVRVYEDHFEWLLNLDTDARGEPDDAGSPVYFKKLTVTPDDEREWFRTPFMRVSIDWYSPESFSMQSILT